MRYFETMTGGVGKRGVNRLSALSRQRKYSVERGSFAFVNRMTRLVVVTGAAALLASPAAAKHRRQFDVRIVPIFGGVSAVGDFMILTDLNGRYPRPIARRSLELKIEPRPPAVPDVSWTATGGVQLRAEPGSPGGFFDMPPMPSTAYIDRAGFVGPFAVTAALGMPVNMRVTMPGFAYERVSLGCASGNPGGIRLEHNGTPAEVTRPEDADIFITGPVNPSVAIWNRCSSGYHDPNAMTYTLHVPGGAVDVTDPIDFPAVSARNWRGRVSTSFTVDCLGGTLLWRTRDGRLAKTLITPVGQTLRNPSLIPCVDDDGKSPAAAGTPDCRTSPLNAALEVDGATLAGDANEAFADNAAAQGAVPTRSQ